MFSREALSKLEAWKLDKKRKPLIIRGARQVGKTTLIEIFSNKFEQYIYLNLEKPSNAKIFEEHADIKDIVEIIFLEHPKHIYEKETLLFIDEIQNSSKAIMMLRYFFEEYPNLYVIAAGSLLEAAFGFNKSFPVGRVEYLFLYPLSFKEYLVAKKENKLLELINELPFPIYAHEKALKDFYRYTLIGGMPEIVANYISNDDVVVRLGKIYDSIILSYLDDIEKYATNNTQARIIRYIMQHLFQEIGQRIKFEGFGKSNYKYREMREAFDTIEKAMFLKLKFPTIDVKLPITQSLNKSPKLFLLDTGLINYFAGLQKEVFSVKDISDAHAGKIAEHIVGQELVAYSKSILNLPTFWVREKKQSTAEVDYIYQFENLIIPIEVKSGKVGRLRSLMLFIDKAPHNFAVRIYSGKLSIEKAKTINGKEFNLLNLPFFLISVLEQYLKWMIKQS